MARRVTDYFHSEEANDIMGKMPSWLIRQGLGVIFLLFVCIILGSYFIRSPETVQAPIIITTAFPPADLVARFSGRIDSLFFQNDDWVEKGEVIAVLSATACYHDVLFLKGMLDISDTLQAKEIIRQQWVSSSYSLGELQTFFSDFRIRCMDYSILIHSNSHSNRQVHLKKQLAKYHDHFQQLITQRALIQLDLTMEYSRFQRDSLLYEKGAISFESFEKIRQQVLQKEVNLVNFDATLSSAEINLLQLEYQLSELDIIINNERFDYEKKIKESLALLHEQIKQWIHSYAFIAPTEGKISLPKYWSNHQYIMAGERLASVVPVSNPKIIAKVQLSPSGIGKVSPGQTIIIKLDAFPYIEHGLLRGVVKYISHVPENDIYLAEIEFPDGLVTSYGDRLPLIHRMTGVGDIVTKETRLITRLIYPIKLLLNRPDERL